jgi:hypothetical protein
MIDLKQFCSTDRIRFNLHNPFSQGEFTYATDGRVAVRVPRIMDFPEADKPAVSGIFLSYFKDGPKGSIKVDLPEITTGEQDCKECGGTGHEHDCPDCTCECDFCDGDGTVPHLAKVCVTIGDALYDAAYIKQILSLPGLKFAEKPSKEDAAPFVFDGGEGILMPMRYAAEGTEIIPASIEI